MVNACWAVYYHFSSSPGNQNHEHCPEGCKYKKTGHYKPKNKYYPIMMPHLLPIFEDLLDEENLKTCLPGLTTNANESFNAQIWRRVPKTVYVGRDHVLLGLNDAIICRNESYLKRCKVFENLGLEAGFNFKVAMVELDEEKEKNRQKIRTIRRNRLANIQDEDDEHYEPGANE